MALLYLTGSNRRRRQCVCTGYENLTSARGGGENRTKKNTGTEAFVCKYKSGQKWEPETVSEIECFHSPALDMDYVFFFPYTGVICGPLVASEATVRKSAD